MKRACRPLTAWRPLAALAVLAVLAAPAPADAQPCSPSSCPRVSFGDAPRSYPAGDGPSAAAAADLDEDGRVDLVVAANTGLLVLRGAAGGYGLPEVQALSAVPRGVATADFNFDGHRDVVVALGSPGGVQVFLGNGTGSLAPGPVVPAGSGLAAVLVGDFDGNGAPDVAVASEGTNQVLVLLGDGAGNLGPPVATSVGSGPRALAAGDLDATPGLDLAVACAGGSEVRVLLGSGAGAFAVGAVLPVGASPWGVAAGDVDGNGTVDLVTADRGVDPDYRVSVFKGNGNGTFASRVSYPVDPLPTGVALVPVDDSGRPDIVVATASLHTVNVLLDDRAGGFLPASRHAVRTRPQAVVPVDVDLDGRLDLAVPCKGSDAVAVLLARPPSLGAASRVAVGAQPQAAAVADLDRDGDLDLAVANTGGNSVSVLVNDGGGRFTTPRPALAVGSGSAPTAVAAADFDRDGIPDLAVNDSGGSRVVVFRGLGGTFESARSFPAGPSPDDLAAADVDGDGDLDLLVCNKVAAGTVSLLRNISPAGGPIRFTDPQDPGDPKIYRVGDNPTSIAVADFDRDGRPDFAVANDRSGSASGPYTVSVRYGAAGPDFPTLVTLDLAGGEIPFSVAAGDFDGDGDPDLGVAEWGTDTVSFFENRGASFATPPSRVVAPDVPVHLAAADVNRDGRADVAVAAAGLSVRRGPLLPATPGAPTEDYVAGLTPSFVAVGDWNGDLWPDAAVVNRGSNDVSILLSTACTARRLDVSLHPAACGAGPGPYTLEAVLEARDDGGNLAACSAGEVAAAIAPGTGTSGARLTGTASAPPSVALSAGVAAFTVLPSGNHLQIDRPGRRYRLAFSLAGLAPAVSRSFTLGPQPAVLGPAAFCPATVATYSAEESYDAYVWTLTPPGAPPLAYTPTVTLAAPPLTPGSYALALSARVDGCAAGATRSIWYGSWQRTTLAIAGPSTVCVDCLGGTVTATEEGGGAVSTRQWGYRPTAGGAVTPIPGETGATYVVKGTDFPGPGDYRLVVSSTVACPSAAPQVSDELPVTVSPEVPDGEVQFLAVTSRGSGTTGESLVQWVNATAGADEIRIRWRKAPTGTSACAPPLVPEGGAGVEEHIVTPAPAESRSQWLHAGLEPATAYCYGLFVRRGSEWAPGRVVKARPFDASGPVKWAYSTGATAVVPPAVGAYGVLVMSNDRTVHAVERGSTGGAWPADWVPHALTGVSHSRSPVIPLGTPLAGADSVLFAGDDLGWIAAVNARTGQELWKTRAPELPEPATVTGAPGAILRQWGGSRDRVLVGTRRSPATGASDILALDLANPENREVFSGGGTPFRELGPISGSPWVDYKAQRVYFASRRRAGGDTLWALDTAASLSHAWSLDPGGEFDSSPVLRHPRLYVGDTAGVVYSIDVSANPPTLPGDMRTMSTLDGPVKGFLFPDRRNNDLFFATNTRVWCVSDADAGFTTNWTWTAPGLNPSVVLHWPNTSYVFFGGQDGKLYQLDFSHDPASPQFARSVTLGDGAGRVGAPSLDVGVEPPAVSPGKKLLVVGSEAGVLYGVEVPLP